MFLLLSSLSLYWIAWFVLTILIDAFIIKLFTKKINTKFSKIFSEISFVKIPTIIIALLFGWIIWNIVWIILWLINITNQLYHSVIGFSIIYIFMYNMFLKSAISNLNFKLNTKKMYIISTLSLIITVIINIIIQIITINL